MGRKEAFDAGAGDGWDSPEFEEIERTNMRLNGELRNMYESLKRIVIIEKHNDQEIVDIGDVIVADMIFSPDDMEEMTFKLANMVDVVQLVRASDCGSECRGFESHLPPRINPARFISCRVSCLLPPLLSGGQLRFITLSVFSSPNPSPWGKPHERRAPSEDRSQPGS